MIILASGLLLVAAPVANAEPGMFVGVSDDSFEWNAASMAATANDLGLRAVRVTLNWTPGQRALSAGDREALGRVVAGADGLRVVLAAFNQGYPPLDDGSRDAYCSYVADAITRFPAINDVVIWNEPNLSGFWRPQFGPPGQSAPEQYEALLARCYDVLHALRPSINVIAPATSLWGNDNPNAFSNISHSPTTFIEDLGAAYRASGRSAPLFDTLGHHPYPASSSERPWVVHADPTIISLGDLGRLLSVMQEAFGGRRNRCRRADCRSGTSRRDTRPSSLRRRARRTTASKIGPALFRISFPRNRLQYSRRTRAPHRTRRHSSPTSYA